jgi:hypothetical protein
MLRWRAWDGLVLLVTAALVGLLSLEAWLAAAGERKLAAGLNGGSVLAAVALVAAVTWPLTGLVSALRARVTGRRAPAPAGLPDPSIATPPRPPSVP